GPVLLDTSHQPSRGRFRQLRDQELARPRRFPRTEMASADARRTHRRNLRQSYHRDRRPSRPAASHRCQANCIVSEYFTQFGVVDFEYEVLPGGLPDPLCMVAYVLNENLQHVHTIRMWRDQLLASTRPPFDIGSDTLFVAYSAWAEMTCFKVRGWQFPVHIFDLHTAYLAVSNILLPYNPDEK